MEEVIQFANKGGYVMGVCNGFQILTESHLLPGALLHNNNHRFICKNVHITPQTQTTALTADLTIGQAYQIPIAHGEGNYFADADTLKKINDNEQVLFRYCDAKGQITPESNPNGAIENIAGVTNAGKNVFGMMPHPERAADGNLSNQDGRLFFESLLKHALAHVK
jgi:phosphoribosylformylglycinamidine synthase